MPEQRELDVPALETLCLRVSGEAHCPKPAAHQMQSSQPDMHLAHNHILKLIQ